MKPTFLTAVFACLILPAALAAPAHAQAQTTHDSPWNLLASADDAPATPEYTPTNHAPAPPEKVSAEVDFALYLWLTSLGGRTTANGQDLSLDLSFLDLLDDTDSLIGFMGHAELNINRVLFMLDPVFTRLEKNDVADDGGVKTNATVKTLWFDIDAGYRFIDRAPLGDSGKVRFSLDGYAGVRITGLKFELDPEGQDSISARQTWADPVIGARLNLDIGEHIGLVFRGDVGGFGAGSEFTTNLLAGFGYRFPLGDEAGLALFAGFRALYQDYEDGDFEWRVWAYGPLLGVQIDF